MRGDCSGSGRLLVSLGVGFFCGLAIVVFDCNRLHMKQDASLPVPDCGSEWAKVSLGIGKECLGMDAKGFLKVGDDEFACVGLKV